MELVDMRDLGDVTSVKVFRSTPESVSPKSKYAPVMELVDMRDLGSRAFSVWVRVPSGAPNKVDSFDTSVSETIDLFLFTKMPVAIHIFMIYSNIIQ